MRNIQTKNLFVSNTSISMFKNCKKKFKYKYIDKIKISPIKSHYLSFGTSLHNTLAELNKLPLELQSYENSIPILEKHWISVGYKFEEDELSYLLQAKDMLKNYCADRKDLGRIIFSEEMIKQYISKNLTLCGKIDKVYVGENEKIEILDFKTGNSFSPIIDLREDMQLPIYLLLLKYKLGVFPSIISYYYLSINHKVTLDVTKEVIDYSLLQLKNIISEINLETKFPFTPTSHCNKFCEYYSSCEYYKNITK